MDKCTLLKRFLCEAVKLTELQMHCLKNVFTNAILYIVTCSSVMCEM